MRVSTQSDQNSGLTLIELLIIIASLGLFLSIVIVVLGSVRFKQNDIQKLRDSRRLSDMAQLRTGLDLYLSQAGGYPDMHLWYSGAYISCGKDKIIQVPKDPGTNGAYFYKNKGADMTSAACGGKVWSDYAIQFETEGSSFIGAAGVYCLTASRGFVVGKCP